MSRRTVVLPGVALLSLLCLASALPAFAESDAADDAGAASSGLSMETIASEVLAAMDRTADPCQDFYRYACGSWVDSTELPSDQARWTRSFSVIRERNREVVRRVLEQAAAQPGSDATRKRIGHFYGACMNEKAAERAGAKPLRSLFKKIRRVDDAQSLMSVTGALHRMGIDTLFGAAVIPDFKNPELNIAFMFQGGLGMPDRDYYVSDDDKKKELLTDYERHVAEMFRLLGDNEERAARQAAEVLAFETELAEVSRDRAQMRDFARLYNKIDRSGLKELTPGLAWDTYFTATGHPGIEDISVATPEFFEALEKLVESTPARTIQTYLRWHVVRNTAELLSSEFVDADFAFYNRKLSGQQQIKPRWKRCVAATEQALGESVGELYVDLMFSGASKDVALEMIGDVEGAFERSLPGLQWMDETTRGRALEKLHAIGNKIGYPDEWRDYASMKIGRASHFDNSIAAAEFEFHHEARKIGRPVDPKEWSMTPQMVNAYYNPLLNEIVFPAGILQPPFFHRDFPAAMNYGAIGGVIGHELTHGYDDQGRKFDPTGRLEEWWEPQASRRFEAQAQCVDDFYSSYEVEPGVSVNGKLTLGENIADIGGLKQGYEAYKRWETRHGAPAAAVEGLSNEQLLFVAWAQVWCSVDSAEQMRLQVTTDPHSPAKFRVNGPMSNNPAFADAFECATGSSMNPEVQCTVW